VVAGVGKHGPDRGVRLRRQLLRLLDGRLVRDAAALLDNV